MSKTDKNFNFPEFAVRPDGVVVPWPVNPANGAVRMEAVAAQGVIVPPTGNETAKYDRNANPVWMVRMPNGNIVQARVGPVLKKLRIEFK